MPSVIDSLVLELGLDPTKWSDGQKKAVEALRKTEEQAIRSAKHIEESGKRAAEFFTKLRNQAIELYAVFTAGRGIKEFVEDITHSDAALGYMSKRLNISVRDLDKWQRILESLGGSADDATSTFENWNKQFQQLALTGENPGFLRFWDALHIKIYDANNQLKTYDQLIKELSEAFPKYVPDKAKAFEFGTSMGITPKMMDLLLKGTEQVRKLKEETEGLTLANETDTEAAQERERTWNNFLHSAQEIGREVFTNLRPALDILFKQLLAISRWIGKHPTIAITFFWGLTAAVVGLNVALAIAMWRLPIVLGRLAGLLVAAPAATAAVGAATAATGVGAAASSAEAMGVLAEAAGLAGAGTAAAGGGAAVAGGLALGPIGWGMLALAGTAALGYAGYKAYQAYNAPETPTAEASGLIAKHQAAWDAAKASEAKYGIPASVTYAQWKLESASGTRMPAGSNNPFGIKAKFGQPYVEAQTHETVGGIDRVVMAKFAKYASLEEAFDAHAKLLATSPAYARARAATTPGQFADALTGTYASDLNYGNKLRSIMNSLPGSTLALAGGGARLGNYDQSRTNNITSETNVGTVVVNTQATDAAGIVRDIKPVLERQSFIANINSGPS